MAFVIDVSAPDRRVEGVELAPHRLHAGRAGTGAACKTPRWRTHQPRRPRHAIRAQWIVALLLILKKQRLEGFGGCSPSKRLTRHSVAIGHAVHAGAGYAGASRVLSRPADLIDAPPPGSRVVSCPSNVPTPCRILAGRRRTPWRDGAELVAIPGLCFQDTSAWRIGVARWLRIDACGGCERQVHGRTGEAGALLKLRCFVRTPSRRGMRSPAPIAQAPIPIGSAPHGTFHASPRTVLTTRRETLRLPRVQIRIAR